MNKPVFTSFSPNVGRSDYLRILAYLCFPWLWAHWKKGNATEHFAKEVQKTFGVTPVFFESGRTALYFALKACGIREGDEVAVQAFTCVVVINAIRALGAIPIYIDIIKERLVMDPKELVEKCSPRTKAVIVQHTFGVPAPMEEIMHIAEERKMAVVEDCAHTIGGEYKGKLLGTFGDVSIFSFGTDKVMSTMRGGMAIAKTKEKERALAQYRDTLPYPSVLTLLRRLAHPLIFALALPLYNKKNIGKAILYTAKKLHLFAHIMTPKEKAGEREGYRKERFANVLADLGLHQWKQLQKRNHARRVNASYYLTWCKAHGIPVQAGLEEEGVIPVRVTAFFPNRDEVNKRMREKQIFLGDWYTTVIAPKDTLLKNINYREGSCPKAESVTKEVLNFPTHEKITCAQREKILYTVPIQKKEGEGEKQS